MGTSDDIMQLFIVNDIRRHFPECEGWQVTPLQTLSGYDQIFQVQRLDGMNREIITLGFSFEKIVPDALLEKIRLPAGTKTPPDTFRTRRAILVPGGSDLSGIGSRIEVYTMKNFQYHGPSLVWLKHPKQRFERIRRSAEERVPVNQ